MNDNFIMTLPATEVKNRFGAVLREITRTGGPFLIERSGKPIAVILSIDAYEKTSRTSLVLRDDQIALIRATFGMWAERKDISGSWLEDGRKRWRSEWRDG